MKFILLITLIPASLFFVGCENTQSVTVQKHSTELNEIVTNEGTIVGHATEVEEHLQRVVLVNPKEIYKMKYKTVKEDELDSLVDCSHNPHEVSNEGEAKYRREIDQIVPRLTKIFSQYGEATPDDLDCEFGYGYEVFHNRNYLFCLEGDVAEKLDASFISEIHKLCCDMKTWMFVVDANFEGKGVYLIFKDGVVYHYGCNKKLKMQLGIES